MLRRTKIVATIGPASEDYDTLKKMIDAGLNVTRMNFSHGAAEDHIKRVATVRKAAKDAGKIVGILADLQGPKIRIAKFKNKQVNLVEGEEFILDSDLPSDAGDEHQVGIDYKELPRDIIQGDLLLLDDGRIILTAKKIDGAKIICEVTVGGMLSNNKGINRQGGGLSAAALTDKDKKDLKTAVSLDVDYIAISFVRDAADVLYAKELIEKEGGKAGVIAKIERLEAVVPETLDEIIKASDGIMVARGDLGVEIGDANVPAAQKHMIQRARALDKPVITATQMMETMIHNMIPTRAEVSDVANAVLDNTDAVMLSAESATGDHPVVVIKALDRICTAAEQDLLTQTSGHRVECFFERIDETISMAAMYAANHMNAAAIICMTESGSTPLWMSRIRSGIPIFALSRHQLTLGKMSLFRDVRPLFFDVTKVEENRFIEQTAIAEVKSKGLIKAGDVVIITRGPQKGVHGGTNSMQIMTVK